MKPVICPYCNHAAELIPSDRIYRKHYGNLWYCDPCNAYVGCHKDSDEPLGTLAKASLRALRKKAHLEFDPCWKSGRLSRTNAYYALSKLLDVPMINAHIAMCDEEQCRKIINHDWRNEK